MRVRGCVRDCAEVAGTSIFLSAAMMSKVCATPSFCVTVHVIDPCSPSRPSSDAPSLRMDMAFSYLVRVAMLVGG